MQNSLGITFQTDEQARIHMMAKGKNCQRDKDAVGREIVLSL